ncbi:MAG TPA: T9SS type A sorting domain-containing protein [Chryseolinea sp.]
MGTVNVSIADGQSIILAGTSFDNYVNQPSLVKIDLAGNIVWATTTKDKDVYVGGVPQIQKAFLSGGFVYATCVWNYSGDAEFWKVSAATGDIIWKLRTTFTEPNHSIADFDANTFIALFNNLYDPYDGIYRRVVAFIDKSSGTIKRTHIVSTKIANSKEVGLAVDSDKNIYYTKYDSIFKVSGTEPTTLLWKRRHIAAGVESFQKVYVDENDNVYAFGSAATSTKRGVVVAVEKNAGDLRWNLVADTGDCAFSALQDYNGSLYVTWQHLYVGGGYSYYWTTRLNRATGAKEWSSSHSFSGISGVARTVNSEAAKSLNIDSNGDVYLNGYYNASNYGPGTWGLLKLNGATGEVLYEKTLPENLAAYQTLSSGVASHIINGNLYLVGNMQVETDRYAPALIKVNQTTGAAVETHLVYGKFRYPSQVVTLKKLPNNNVVVLKQEGRFVKVAQYTSDGTLSWERKLGKPYILYGDNLTIGPNGTIHVLCHVRQDVSTTPFVENNPANVCTFALDPSGQVLKETFLNYYGSFFPSAGITLPRFMSADATNEYAFYQRDNELIVRRVTGTTLSNETKFDIFYSRSPDVPVFDETSTTLRLFGIVNGIGPKFIDLNKATMAQTGTVINSGNAALFYSVKQIVKLNADEVLLYGEHSYLGDYLVRYNMTQAKVVWFQRYVTTRIEPKFMTVASNGKTCYLGGTNGLGMYVRKIDMDQGALSWTYNYNQPSVKAIPTTMVVDEAKGKILLAGYHESTSNPDDKTVMIDVVSTGGVHDYTITKTSTKPWSNMATTALVSNGDFMVGGSHDHPSYPLAGFVFGLQTAAASGCEAGPVNEQVTKSICEGDVFMFGNQSLSTAGVFTKTFTAKAGCDSTVVLTLRTNPVYQRQVSVNLCNGQTYVFGNQILSAAGTYSQTFRSTLGCDSTVTVDVTENMLYHNTVDTLVCAGEPVKVGGETLSKPGSYVRSLKTRYGCDSTVTVNLAWKAPVDNSIRLSGRMLIASQAGAVYQWLDMTTNQPIPGATGAAFTPDEPGKYAVEITFDQCKVVSDTYTLNILGAESNQKRSIAAYPVPAHNRLAIEAGQTVIRRITLTDAHGVEVLQKAINQSGHIELDIEHLAPGVFILTTQTDEQVSSFRIVKQ